MDLEQQVGFVLVQDGFGDCITAEGITTLFFHRVYLYFGLHDKAISDWDPQFASSFAWELGKLLKDDLSLSTAYHPQFDGEMEWVNQGDETYL